MSRLNLNNVEFLTSFGNPQQLPQSSKPEVAFCGRSNCGKSSLLNKLCNRKNLAKVSSTPGKTTLINFFSAGDTILVDLPGYGFASRSNKEISRWTNLIENYLDSERNIALVVMLLDIRHDPSKQDYMMVDYLAQLGLPTTIALTKADKLSTQKQNNQKIKIPKLLNINDELPIIPVSSVKQIGISELKKQIKLAVD